MYCDRPGEGIAGYVETRREARRYIETQNRRIGNAITNSRASLSVIRPIMDLDPCSLSVEPSRLIYIIV